MARFCFIAIFIPVATAFSADAGLESARKVLTVKADPSSGRLVRRTTLVAPRVVKPVVIVEGKEEAEPPSPFRLGPDASVNEIIDRVLNTVEVP